jgi:hypothetical protein
VTDNRGGVRPDAIADSGGLRDVRWVASVLLRLAGVVGPDRIE